MTFSSFMAFLVFMFVAGGVVLLVLVSFVSEMMFKNLYLKDLERRLVAILEKHGIEVQEEDYHSKYVACNPSIKELVCMLEAVYGINDKALCEKDFSAFHKFLENSIQAKTRTKNTQTPSDSKEYLVK